jgi:hypothetical protein
MNTQLAGALKDNWPNIVFGVAILGVVVLARVPQGEPVAASAGPDTVHPFQANVRVSVDPTTRWQPRAGEVKITLENLNPTDATTLADGLLAVHFRWLTKSGSATWVQSPGVRTVEIPNAKKLVVTATVPQMGNAPSNAIGGLVKDEDGIRTFLTLVPVAELWVTMQKPGKPDFFVDQVTMIGVTTWWVAASAAVLAVTLLLLFLRLAKPPGLKGPNIVLQIIESRGQRASLSQFQIMLWTVIVGAATAYVIAISGNLIPLTSGTLVLLGISGVSALGASLAQQGAVATPAPKGTGGKPEWSDLVASDGEIDVTRVQMLFFTVLVAVYVSVHVIDNYEIPTIPDTFLTLMGISNGVYLANKFVAPSGLSVQDAVQKIIAAGYQAITSIKPKENGAWEATALRAGSPSTVSVARDGTVG